MNITDLHKITYKWDVVKLITDIVGIKVNSFVEIGVYKGDGSAEFRRVFPNAHLYLIDPWNFGEVTPAAQHYHQKGGNVWTSVNECDKTYNEVRDRFKDDDNISIIKQTSMDGMKLVPDGVDVIFIDGSHSYEDVKQDIEISLPKLNKPGLICGHDLNRHEGLPGVRTAVMEKFGNEFMAFDVEKHDDCWAKVIW